MNFLAEQSEVESKNGLPNIQLSESGLFNKSKLNIENQWASHPSQKERITKLRALNIIKEQDNLPAKNIFKNFQKTEEQITSKLFSRVQYQKQKKRSGI
jgi:hypothetical protein